MSTGIIFDVRRYAIHDGPGIRTTVFFKGCPLACRWCHNPESHSPAIEMFIRENRCIRCGACIETCPSGALSWNEAGPATDPARCVRCGACAARCYAGTREMIGREATAEEVMAEVERDLPFYEESGGGATFSGGEPLLQIEFLGELLRACREIGIRTALDTCGYAPWEAIDRIRGHVDLFLYDLKIVDDARHRELTGVSNEIILRNLRALSERGHDILLRVPIIPAVNDDDESLRAIGAFARGLPRVNGIDILPYNRMGVDKYARLNRRPALSEAPATALERMAEIITMLSAYGLPVHRGG